MFEAIRLFANRWSTLPVAASYLSFLKPVCKLDPAVSYRAAQGI